MQQAVKRVILAVLGRPVRCEECGEPLFTGLPILWRGEVRLIGAERARVRVDFASMNRLVFAHALPDECPAQRGTTPS